MSLDAVTHTYPVEQFSDLTIQLSLQPLVNFKVHKQVLALNSKYFEAAIESQPVNNTIQLPNTLSFTADNIKLLFDVLYRCKYSKLLSGDTAADCNIAEFKVGDILQYSPAPAMCYRINSAGQSGVGFWNLVDVNMNHQAHYNVQASMLRLYVLSSLTDNRCSYGIDDITVLARMAAYFNIEQLLTECDALIERSIEGLNNIKLLNVLQLADELSLTNTLGRCIGKLNKVDIAKPSADMKSMLDKLSKSTVIAIAVHVASK